MSLTEFANDSLAADWGPNHGPTMPDTVEVGLIVGDPRLVTPVEFSYPGYARLVRANDATTWDDPVNGVLLSKVLTLPDATGAATTPPADFWAIWLPGAAAADIYNFGRLAEDIRVDAAGPVPAFKMRRAYAWGMA